MSLVQARRAKFIELQPEISLENEDQVKFYAQALTAERWVS